ncbi:DUF1887 family protein [Sulfurimonas sp. SAG-AH-194-C20]|nr:DUF1887 family CARF protein [Sulfurimonas sp. SAG-AH-194-C20]MDF1878145.1 DUF1887 family protein [Sulfurimonas sp. SAG-AH-194-C20]
MILVSIVGDFYSSILPIFYEYKDKITKHIIIYDDFKNDLISAKKIINGTTAFIKKYDLEIKTFSIKLDEDSLKAIHQVIDILKTYTDDYGDLHINVSDGLANIGILFSNEFLAQNTKILTYDRYDNEYNILTKESMKTYKMNTSIPIKDHFLLKDIEVVCIEGSTIADKYKKDLNVFFEKYEADKLLYFNSEMPNTSFKKIKTGFLYEQYVFNLIKELNYDDILLGVKIKDKRLDDIFIENEYDILIMKNNHLHMIECKYLKILDTTALLYKLDSVRESLDEDANICILTDFDKYNDIADLPNSKINPSYKRAFAKKIFVRGSPKNNIETFIREIDAQFGLQSTNINTILNEKENFKSIKQKEREAFREEIQSHLSQKLTLNMDFFDKNTLLLIMQYKTDKRTTVQTKVLMQDEVFKNFILLMNKMLTSKKEYISIYDVYEYYKQHLK